MPNLDIDDDFLKQFYDITSTKQPKEVSLPDLKFQLKNIVDLIKELSANSKKPIVNKALNQLESEQENEKQGPAILIVDDLGVITYQLKILLSNFDYDVDCSQEIYDAVNKYKSRKYRYVVMDLFIPTEREGFILLTELKKMAISYNTSTTVGVITASPRKETEAQCKARGADFFLEKNNDWQTSLYNVMKGYIDAENGNEDEDNY